MTSILKWFTCDGFSRNSSFLNVFNFKVFTLKRFIFENVLFLVFLFKFVEYWFSS